MSSFNEIPDNQRVPGAYVEISSSGAVSTSGSARILVIAQRTSAGTVAQLVPTLITSKAQAISAFGVGSMLASMMSAVFDNNASVEKWAVALDDNGAGTAASGTITFTASSAQAGNVSLYLGGTLVSVAVATNDAAATIAAAVRDAINANGNLNVTATASGGVVTVTFKHKGTVGNSYDMRVNYLTSLTGSSAGEATPSGVTVSIVQLSGGATDPLLSDAFAVLPSQIFDYIVVPYTDSTNLNAVDTEVNSRWTALRMLEGMTFVAYRGTVSQVGTFGNSRNNQHMVAMDAAYNSPTPPFIWAAATGAQAGDQAASDPALPFNGLELVGVLPPPIADRRTISENQTLLFDGIATHGVASDGTVSIQRLATTYQVNSSNIADKTWLDANTALTLSKLRQDVISLITTRFVRYKLADDGTIISAGQSIVTPKIIRSQIVGLANTWAANGLIEDISNFVANLSVTRDANDSSRVNCVLPPNLVNQFQIFASQISFTL